jgi:hypothetical protein
VASAFATVTVLVDSDGDGIPDAWESGYGLNPGSSADRNSDSDGDGMSNWQEYVAGTDPTNALSYLKVENFWSAISSNQQVRLEFNAVSNKTYTIFASDNAPSGPWIRVADVAAVSSNRTAQVTEEQPAGSVARYYHLVTPRAP